MAKQSPIEMSSNLLGRLDRAKSDQSKRRAITGLANFAIELLLLEDSDNLTEVIKIADGLTCVIETRTETPKTRIAALRKVEQILAKLSGIAISTDRLLERLLAVARRRTDESEVSLLTAVEKCGAWRAKTAALGVKKHEWFDCQWCWA